MSHKDRSDEIRTQTQIRLIPALSEQPQSTALLYHHTRNYLLNLCNELPTSYKKRKLDKCYERTTKHIDNQMWNEECPSTTPWAKNRFSFIEDTTKSLPKLMFMAHLL